MKRIAVIGTVGVPGCYGGFETLADHLVDKLGEKYQFSVYCSKSAYSKSERKKFHKGARLYYLPLKANGPQSILYDILSAIHALFIADTLLILGVSGGLIVPFLRLFTNKRIIVNIDGQEWRRGKWGKVAKWFLKFSERVAVRWSHADIADNQAIQQYTSEEYGTLSSLIEYGGDHVTKEKVTPEYAKKYSFLGLPYAFKVARIEPENNVEMILKAFVESKEILVIVGNWNHGSYGKRLLAEYAHYENIHLFHPIYDQQELNVLRSNCLVYVHGHSAGGTNPSLVEAMSLGLPVMAFEVSYNRKTTEGKALFFETSEDLRKMIEESSMYDLVLCKREMAEIAGKRYTWKIIAKKYDLLIQKAWKSKRKLKVKSDFSKLKSSFLEESGISHLKTTLKYYEDYE